LARAVDHPLVDALLVEHGNGLLTRLAALLVDLARSARRLEAPARLDTAGLQARAEPATCSRKPKTGGDQCVGLGLAEAARGLLVHRVEIAEGRVEQYQILAPTEWNFHPEGVVAQGLSSIQRSGVEGPELERLARLYITAVDPCVDYQLSVS
jgi:Ni,Fe-hydrogenase I large subunit